MESSEQQAQAYQVILDCYQQLQQQGSNVVWELLKHEQEIKHWQHFPKGDVKDKRHHSQYYYHAHPSQDQDRVPEHGHFHLFLMKSAFAPTIEPVFVSEKHRQDMSKDALCHLVAIAMDEKGAPRSLFTVNHWVVQGIWYPADVICQAIQGFTIEAEQPSAITNRWISAMVQLFIEPIKALLVTRDTVIADWAKAHPETTVYTDRRLEVTSICKL